MSILLNGEKLRDHLIPLLVQEIRNRELKPKLVIIQIGNNKESNKYIQKKKLLGKKIGAIVVHTKYAENVTAAKVIRDIQKYNQDPHTHGIMIQLPIPQALKDARIIEAIDPIKDVDGLTAYNTKSLFDTKEAYLPATTQGILTLLNHYNIGLEGKKVVIVGASMLVGRPTALALLNRKATVTVCHIHTHNLEEETRRADILIVATGKAGLITAHYVTKKQVVIDVGITITKNKKVVGDVDYAKVHKHVYALSPVPGGVGPMTVVSLYQNLIKACIALSIETAQKI